MRLLIAPDFERRPQSAKVRSCDSPMLVVSLIDCYIRGRLFILDSLRTAATKRKVANGRIRGQSPTAAAIKLHMLQCLADNPQRVNDTSKVPALAEF